MTTTVGLFFSSIAALAMFVHIESAAAQSAQCEAERKQFLAIATGLRDEMKNLPPGSVSEPGSPRARFVCSNLERGIVAYTKGVDYLRRCNGTEKQMADLSETVANMKKDFQKFGCKPAG
jgi:hypothetical protein